MQERKGLLLIFLAAVLFSIGGLFFSHRSFGSSFLAPVMPFTVMT